MDITEPTFDERRLTDSYQGVLTAMTRCAQAIRDGQWAQLALTATDLSHSAVLLAVAAGELRQPTTPPRPATVLDAVTRNHASPIVEMLHPTRASSVAKTAMTDPFTHPGQPAQDQKL